MWDLISENAKRKNNMKQLIASLLLCMVCSAANAQSNAQYLPQDSVKVTNLIKEGRLYLNKQGKNDAPLTLFFARKLLGLPYVAHTLDKNKEERLVINLREMDCTTLVENVLALTFATLEVSGKLNPKYGGRVMSHFGIFAYYLRMLRYEKGQVDYTKRNHYFTGWIENNCKDVLVMDVSGGYTFNVKTVKQKVKVNYMSTHPDAYAMLKQHPKWVGEIKKTEKHLSTLSCPYIPKTEVKNTKDMRSLVKDGDILAIVTDKPGLDIAHLGTAVWKEDGLHMLHASSVQKRVVEDKINLRQYLDNHRSHLGIRVLRRAPR